jgi:SAM-dependent methyltransferase
MDRQTIHAYDSAAAAFADDWHSQPPPDDLHELIRRFFIPGLTADIGCGSGREVAWLARNGFPAIGYDASEGLLGEARSRYPALAFERGILPELSGIAEGRFANVLCETVIMHLPPAAIAPSVRRLVAVLQPGGVLYLSWRVVERAGERDRHGRLYAPVDHATVVQELGGAAILFDEEAVSASSGNRIHRVVARKPRQA